MWLEVDFSVVSAALEVAFSVVNPVYAPIAVRFTVLDDPEVMGGLLVGFDVLKAIEINATGLAVIFSLVPATLVALRLQNTHTAPVVEVTFG